LTGGLRSHHSIPPQIRLAIHLATEIMAVLSYGRKL
jgi:hypothetical protein